MDEMFVVAIFMSFISYLSNFAEPPVNLYRFEWLQTAFPMVNPKTVGELIWFLFTLPGMAVFIVLVTTVFSILYPIYKICSIRIR